MSTTRKAKIVVVAEADIGTWLDGLSLIVRHFIRHLPSRIDCDVWSVGGPGDAVELSPECSFHALRVTRDLRFAWVLRILGFKSGYRRAADANSPLWDACVAADAIYIFSSANSPITAWILASWPSKTLLHLTDCGSLHEKRLGNFRTYTRYRLIEWKLGRAPLSAIIFVSTFDAQFYRNTSRTKTPVIPTPLGVDTEKFRPSLRQAVPGGYAEPFKILFTGVLSYPPNAQAALFLAKEILPLLPHDVRLIIAGTNPSAELYALSNRDPRLVITGAVPRIEEIYAEADLFVAPMFVGAGMQNKILEALSSALPVVTTPICALAFSKVPEALCVCPDNVSMVAAIERFKQDEAYREMMAHSAREFAVTSLSWSRRTAALLSQMGVE